MPTQLSDVFTEDATTFTYDSSHETWIVNENVEVGSGERYAFLSAYSNSKLKNSGIVYSETLYAVRFSESETVITNKKGGTIRGEQGAINLGQSEVQSNVLIKNYGNLIGSGEASNGIYSFNISNLKIENSKKIKADQYGIFIRSDAETLQKGVVVKNSGKIIGEEAGMRNATVDHVKVKIKNTDNGLIKGKGDDAVLSSAGALKLNNKGKIKGDVHSNDAESSDKVVNKGKIKGDVYLGNGDDVYKNKGGTAGLVYGEKGNDLLVAGAGIDQFVFDTRLNAETNVDTVEGFEPGVDKLVLDMTIFASLTAAGPLSQSNFVKGDAAQDGDDYIIYDPQSGAVSYDRNGDTGAGPVQFAQLDPNLDLKHSDFIVVA